MDFNHYLKKNKTEKKCDVSTDLSSCYNNFYPLLENKLKQTENITIGFVNEISRALEEINLIDDLQDNEKRFKRKKDTEKYEYELMSELSI